MVLSLGCILPDTRDFAFLAVDLHAMGQWYNHQDNNEAGLHPYDLVQLRVDSMALLQVCWLGKIRQFS
jgi:hypothetical protein